MLRYVLGAVAALCLAAPAQATVTVTTNPSDIVGSPAYADRVDIHTIANGFFAYTSAGQIGFWLSSPADQTISYYFNNPTGEIFGTFALTAETPFFIGFTGITSGPVNQAGFQGTSELDLVSSVVGAPAVPEPATWAMMLLGMTLIGGALRYRRGPRQPGRIGRELA